MGQKEAHFFSVSELLLATGDWRLATTEIDRWAVRASETIDDEETKFAKRSHSQTVSQTNKQANELKNERTNERTIKKTLSKRVCLDHNWHHWQQTPLFSEHRTTNIEQPTSKLRSADRLCASLIVIRWLDWAINYCSPIASSTATATCWPVSISHHSWRSPVRRGLINREREKTIDE